MDIKIQNQNSLYKAHELMEHILQGYFAKIDIIRDAATISGWTTNYTLSNFTKEGLTTDEKAIIFSVSKPADFTHNQYNSLYFSVYNLRYLLAKYLGETTTPTNVQIEDYNTRFVWGYDDTKLYIFIPTFGSESFKYIFWLPSDYTTKESNLFFNKIHTFTLDYATQ